jgi:hypothetical protein
VKFIYVALATLFSLYLCFGVATSTPPHTSPLLIAAGRGLAIVCLVSCAVAMHNWRISAVLVLPTFLLYVGFAFTQPDEFHLGRFVTKLAATVCACLGAAMREDKEEAARSKDVPLTL